MQTAKKLDTKWSLIILIREIETHIFSNHAITIAGRRERSPLINSALGVWLHGTMMGRT